MDNKEQNQIEQKNDCFQEQDDKRKARAARFGLQDGKNMDEKQNQSNKDKNIQSKDLYGIYEQSTQDASYYGSLNQSTFYNQTYNDNKRGGKLESRKKRFAVPKTSNQIKYNLERYNKRLERFGTEFLSKKQYNDLNQLKKDLEWVEHKCPPAPILQNSQILLDSLYLYGVDYMSTRDIQQYFKRYQVYNQSQDNEEIQNPDSQVKWINDSSCVYKFSSNELARKAYSDLQLSESRIDDKLPPLTLYLEDYQEFQKLQEEKKKQNPDYDTLFDVQQNVQENEQNFMEVDQTYNNKLDPRNSDPQYGFIDAFGYTISIKPGQVSRLPANINPHQNLWIRYATDFDQKSEITHGKDSRYYKFTQTLKGYKKAQLNKLYNKEENKNIGVQLQSKTIKKEDREIKRKRIKIPREDDDEEELSCGENQNIKEDSDQNIIDPENLIHDQDKQ